VTAPGPEPPSKSSSPDSVPGAGSEYGSWVSGRSRKKVAVVRGPTSERRFVAVLMAKLAVVAEQQASGKEVPLRVHALLDAVPVPSPSLDLAGPSQEITGVRSWSCSSDSGGSSSRSSDGDDSDQEEQD
jgi:hypothetical protein